MCGDCETTTNIRDMSLLVHQFADQTSTTKYDGGRCVPVVFVQTGECYLVRSGRSYGPVWRRLLENHVAPCATSSQYVISDELSRHPT